MGKATLSAKFRASKIPYCSYFGTNFGEIPRPTHPKHPTRRATIPGRPGLVLPAFPGTPVVPLDVETSEGFDSPVSTSLGGADAPSWLSWLRLRKPTQQLRTVVNIPVSIRFQHASTQAVQDFFHPLYYNPSLEVMVITLFKRKGYQMYKWMYIYIYIYVYNHIIPIVTVKLAEYQ